MMEAVRAKAREAKEKEARKAAEAERQRAIDRQRAAEAKKAAEEKRAAERRAAEREKEREKAVEKQRAAKAREAAEAQRLAEAAELAEKEAAARRALKESRLVVLRRVPRTAGLFDVCRPLDRWQPGPVLDARLEDGVAMIEFYTAEAAQNLLRLVTETDDCVIRGRIIKMANIYPGRLTPPAGRGLETRALRIDVGPAASIEHQSSAFWFRQLLRQNGFDGELAAVTLNPNRTYREVHFGSLEHAKWAKELLERQQFADVHVHYVSDPAEKYDVDFVTDTRRALFLARFNRGNHEDMPETWKDISHSVGLTWCLLLIGTLWLSTPLWMPGQSPEQSEQAKQGWTERQLRKLVLPWNGGTQREQQARKDGEQDS